MTLTTGCPKSTATGTPPKTKVEPQGKGQKVVQQQEPGRHLVEPKRQQQEAEGQLVFPDSSWGQRNSRWNRAAKRNSTVNLPCTIYVN
jgi:hypothetical protein